MSEETKDIVLETVFLALVLLAGLALGYIIGTCHQAIIFYG